jgi:hypothetical protein
LPWAIAQRKLASGHFKERVPVSNPNYPPKFSPILNQELFGTLSIKRLHKTDD